MNSVFEANGLFAEPFQKVLLPLRDSSRSHIVLAVADEVTVREEVTAELGERLTGAYTFFEFDHANPPEPSLPRFCRSLARQAPILVLAHGLEVLARRDAEAYDTALHFLNAHREDITLSPCGLVLWLTTRTLADVMERAPDFADWQSACATFALAQDERLERTSLGRLSITEAELLRRQVRRFAEMLRRPNLDPALATDFEKQRRVAETQLGRVADVRRDYRLHLVDALRDHLIRGFAPQVGGRVISLPLAKIFLPLRAVEGRPALAEYAEQDLHRGSGERSDELSWRHQQAEIERRRSRPQAREGGERSLGLAELLKQRRAVLLGDPGTGKTTITRYVAYALAADDRTHIGDQMRGLLPVLVRLASYGKAFNEDRDLDLIAYVESQLTPRVEFGRCLRKGIEAGECLIILDGLDELTDPELRVQVTTQIRTLVENFGANHFLVTSRIVGYERSSLTREFKHATLRELEIGEKERFVELWYAAIRTEIPESSHTAGEASLIEALRTKPQIARMAANPLLLTIMVLMHWRGIKLPSRRVQVYQNATDTLIEYWTAERVALDAEEVKQLLAPIAHHILSSSVGGVIGRGDLLPRLHASLAEQRGCDRQEAKRMGDELLAVLSEQSGIFLERGLDPDQQPVYGFLHQTFGEYLAALHLASEFLEGSFELERYIHRNAWREPLLLLSGHLSLISPKRASELLQKMMDFPCPYEDVLHRNVMLAADCLADDVQVMPALREKILGKLAALLVDPAAQVREKAVECHQRLAVTRHREAAAKLVTQLVPPSDQLQGMAAGHLLSLAGALLHLHERDAAAQILSLRKGFHKEELLRLRFEGWPEEGARLLLEMHEDGRLPVVIRSDLTSCRLGPVDLGLIQRLLGRGGLQSLVAKLLEMVPAEERERHASLRWLAALAAQPPAIEMITKLTAADTPPFIRKLAAEHMLNEGHRSHAIAVLQDLCANEPSEAAYAAIALLEADEKSKLDWVLLREISLLANHPDAPEAIRALLRGERSDIAVPAALHFLATWRGDDFDLLSVVRDLMKAGQNALGLAAARWLAMRPGFEYRFEACEILLNAERREEARRLLEYLAHECHGEVRLRAYRELQLLGGAEHVIPALVRIATKDTPELRYEVSFSLALAHHAPSAEAVESHRFSSKAAATLSERTEAYKSALRDFHEVGKATLKELESTDDRIQATRSLALLSLDYLTGSGQFSGQIREIADLAMNPWPVVNLNLALFALRAGHVDQARQILTEGLEGLRVNVSALVFRKILFLASPTFNFASPELLIDTLQAPGSHLRVAAARALGNTESSAALQHLTIALGDEASELRSAAADALGQLRDPAALQPLTAALHDPVSDVRGAATSALEQLRAPAALRSLLTTLADRASRVRREGAWALGRLRDSAAVRPLIAALADGAEEVRAAAAWALGRLRDGAAIVQPLIGALGADDSYVCYEAVYALDKIRARTAIEPLLNTLSHDNFDVRKAAALTLAKLRSPTLAQRLMAMLADERSNTSRSAVAFALARIGDRSVIQPLITALDRETGSRRHFIACALGLLKQPVALEPLIAALTEGDFIVRQLAAFSLGELREPAALEPLIAALGDESAGVRMAAATALREFQGTPTIQPLIGALNDDAGEVRSSAAETLGHLRATEAVEALMITLNADGGDVRDEAALALGRIGDGAAIQPLMAMLVDAPASRPAIARALSRLGATEAVPLLVATAQPESLYLEALIHLDPASALAVLDRFGQRLCGENWADRVRGQALWRLGDEAGALAALRRATEQADDEVDNLLALARFHLERGEPEAASKLVDQALRNEPYSAICLLTRAVVLQGMGRSGDAIASLEQARWENEIITDADDLRFDHFWNKETLATLADLLTLAEMPATLSEVAEPRAPYDGSPG